MDKERRKEIKQNLKHITIIEWKFDKVMEDMLTYLSKKDYLKLKKDFIESLESNIDRYDEDF